MEITIEKINERHDPYQLFLDSIKNIIDTKFRNALAHGWYRIENHQIVYFEESIESDPKIMDEIEMLGRLTHLKIFGMALSHIVLAGDWELHITTD